MKKKLITAGILILAAGGIIWMVRGNSSRTNVTYETEKITRGDISNSVTATGTVEPVTQVEVGTQVSGIVNRIYVDYNSVVKKGEIIAELDKTNLQNELASKKSTMENAKTEYEYQLKNYTRASTLHEKKLISDTDYELALYNYQKAKNSFDISRNDVAKAETNLGYATIYSPIDGVVLSKAVEEGQTVAASFSTPTLFTIANDLTDMQVVADVDEADIGGVALNQNVTFTVDAFPADTFRGVVTQVRQEPQTTNNVVTYEVVVSAPNPDLKLKPGLTANITIYTLERKNVLKVSSKALHFTPLTSLAGKDEVIKDCPGKQKVWTREGKTFIAHPVQSGISDGVSMEITSGVTEGLEVLTEAVPAKAPGEKAVSQEETEKESSPFMPGRPGKRTK